MGKGGGGGVDTSGLEEATRASTALQENIYEQTREDYQPWYNVGKSAIGRLSDLLGISGGSVRSREQIYNELMPQYTTQQEIGGSGSLYIAPDGGVVDLSNLDFGRADDRTSLGKRYASADRDILGVASNAYKRGEYDKIGLTPLEQSSVKDVVNYDALNAAVQEQLSAQADTPEDYGSLLERFSADKFEEDPGYQFRQDESQKALERAMAAQGVTLGGGGGVNPRVARALQEQSQGLASQEYGSAYNRYVNDQLNTFNMLMGTSGQGSGVANAMGAAGQNYATNVGNLQTGLASAQLNAQMANAAQPSMFSSLLGTGAQLGSAAILASDLRVKESIVELEPQNGHKMYEFSYKGDPKRYIGVMAQDVQKTHPKAVKEIDGVLHVDYSQLGVEMREA